MPIDDVINRASTLSNDISATLTKKAGQVVTWYDDTGMKHQDTPEKVFNDAELRLVPMSNSLDIAWQRNTAKYHTALLKDNYSDRSTAYLDEQLSGTKLSKLFADFLVAADPFVEQPDADAAAKTGEALLDGIDKVFKIGTDYIPGNILPDLRAAVEQVLARLEKVKNPTPQSSDPKKMEANSTYSAMLTEFRRDSRNTGVLSKSVAFAFNLIGTNKTPFITLSNAQLGQIWDGIDQTIKLNAQKSLVGLLSDAYTKLGTALRTEKDYTKVLAWKKQKNAENVQGLINSSTFDDLYAKFVKQSNALSNSIRTARPTDKQLKQVMAVRAQAYQLDAELRRLDSGLDATWFSGLFPDDWKGGPNRVKTAEVQQQQVLETYFSAKDAVLAKRSAVEGLVNTIETKLRMILNW